MRNHLPWRFVVCGKEGVRREDLAGCTTLIIPGTRLLSDKAVADLKTFPGRLIAAGEECGGYDENYMQRAADPFPETEKIPLADHEIIAAGNTTMIRWTADNWRGFFPELPAVKLNPECAADFKCTPDGVIAGLLITSPVKSCGGPVELPPGAWTAEVFGGEKQPLVFRGNSAVIPPFAGACVLERKL